MSREGFQSGLTRGSVLAIFYAILVFIPAVMYLTLVTGIATVPVQWFVLLLWVELAKISGRKITKQEGILIFMLSGAQIIVPTGFIYNAYLRNSDIAQLFGLSEKFPNWIAPPLGSGAWEQRNLFHPDFMPVYLVWTTSFIFLAMNICLGLLARETFIEVENLPFPVAEMVSQGVTVLTGKEERPSQILSVAAVGSFIYGFFLYTFPFLYQAISGSESPSYIIPIPWIDLTSQIETSLPGAMFGIFTDIAPIASAFILPFSTVIGIFIGSFGVWFVGSWLSVAYQLAPDIDPITPGYQSWWLRGMTIGTLLQRGTLYFWATLLIGLGLAAGLGPLIRRPGIIKKSISSLRLLGKVSKGSERSVVKRRTDSIDLRLITITLPLTFIGSTIIYFVLAPDFIMQNLWLIPLNIFLPIIAIFISGRALGETGLVVGVTTNLRNVVYTMSGYPGVDIWFVPSAIAPAPWARGPPGVPDGSTFLNQFKMAAATKTSVKSVMIGYVILFPVAILVGLFYAQIFWSIAPIPSGRYPASQIFWPVTAVYQSLWITGREYGLFEPLWILGSTVVNLGLFFVLDFVRSPITLMAIAVGGATNTPYSLTLLLGGVIGLVIKNRMGNEWWGRHRTTLAAGLVMGEGIAVVLAVCMSLIISSIWIRPF